MSKQSSLLNFFNKTPDSKAKKFVKLESTKSTDKDSFSSRKTVGKENLKVVKKSRKRLIVDQNVSGDDDESEQSIQDPIPSDDSEDEFVPGNESESSISEEDTNDITLSSSLSANSDVESSPVKVGQKKRKRGASGTSKKKMLSSEESNLFTNSKLDVLPAAKANDGLSVDGNWSFLKFDFLKEEKIRDSMRRRPSDPNYDPRTLYVPPDFLNSLTPGMRQWWDLKSKHYDCVLFFKVGKFYEFYHMDAVIGVKELNLTFMRGEYAHCGFPEISYSRFSLILVDKGYKVARVEQTETPEMAAERCKMLPKGKSNKFVRVVRREICQLTSKGTQISSVNEKNTRCYNYYLLAICEKELSTVTSEYGVCFVDPSIGIFYIGQFKDDKHSSRLRTLIATHPPSEVVLGRGQVSNRTNSLINQCCSGVLRETLAPRTEFLTPASTVTALAEGNYFPDQNYPPNLLSFCESSEGTLMGYSDNSLLGLSSLGAIVWVLKRALVDHQLISMGQFQVYEPVDAYLSNNFVPKNVFKNMVLDETTLKNLNVIDNGIGGTEGSLLHKVDNCQTAFGKRVLLGWLCTPVTDLKVLHNRQQAVCVLKSNPNLMKEVRFALGTLPDLERLLARIHAGSTKGLPPSHPSTRAVLFEQKTYSKKKIAEFISVLNGFQSALGIIKILIESDVSDSSLLTSLVSPQPHGFFPCNLKEHLSFFRNAFNAEEAEKDGIILPNAKGVDPEYDAILDTLKGIDEEINCYLKDQCTYFGCLVKYVGTAKNRYQLEVPEAYAKKAGRDYNIAGQRKGFKRFITSKTKELLERMMAAEVEKTNILLHLGQRMFTRFTDHFDEWKSATECIAEIDVLCSFAEYYLSQDGDMCMPVIQYENDNELPYIEIINGRYPCQVSDDFISNDTLLGKNDCSIMVLTGPNMGGKSTLMRQTALIVILAHIGSGVPATSCKLSPVDRIFTRIGAYDDIVAGHSTFYVELCETATILQHATQHSLILIDELGRGTSTYDGSAIASAVLKELSHRSPCPRSIFSTHYHSLLNEAIHSNISLVHMSCMVKDDGQEESITFLYKVASGACPKSYGFNAARLAGLPSAIVQVARSTANKLQQRVQNRSIFRNILSTKSFSHTSDIFVVQ